MINATSTTTKKELIPSGNYVARCYSMIHLGTITEVFLGETKQLNKVRISWELPTELKVFKEENGEQPYVISKDFTLSLHEKSNLRKILASWRGKDFSDAEATKFDITNLIGVPCMLNVIHKHGVKDPSKIYEEIGSISPMPKGIVCPPQANKSFVLDYDNFSFEAFDKLPDFIKDKMKGSEEFKKMQHPALMEVNGKDEEDDDLSSDLPF